MKSFGRLAVLSLSTLPFTLLPSAALAETASHPGINGTWQGVATVRGTDIPIAIRISGSGANLKAAFLNGPASHPDEVPASSVTVDGDHIVASFDYFARKLDATLAPDGSLTGTYGAAKPGAKAAPTPFTLKHVDKPADPTSAANAPDISGSWFIATKSSKGESAWEFRVDPPQAKSPVIKAVISASTETPAASGAHGTAPATPSATSPLPAPRSTP